MTIYSVRTPPHHPTPPQTQLCLILPKLLIFQVSHQNKSCLSILEESKNGVRQSWCKFFSKQATTQPPNKRNKSCRIVYKNNMNFIKRKKLQVTKSQKSLSGNLGKFIYSRLVKSIKVLIKHLAFTVDHIGSYPNHWSSGVPHPSSSKHWCFSMHHNVKLCFHQWSIVSSYRR